MSILTFAERGGFKLLAVSRLSAGAYSLVCYLLNCTAAGAEEVLSTSGELSVMLGITERLVRSAIDELASSHIIELMPVAKGPTFRLRICLDCSKWENLRRAPQNKKRTQIGDAHNIHPMPSHDALVFPAQRIGNHKLQALAGGKEKQNKTPQINSEEKLLNDALQIYDAFLNQKSQGTHNPDKEKSYAHLLVESHPVEQILALIQHFGAEIPSLGMLAGAWLHYSEKFHKLNAATSDLQNYRKKHFTDDKKLRNLSQAELKRGAAGKVLLTDDEQLLLQIFVRHENPRRQLYWALQAKERYPHLDDFFVACKDLAIPPDTKKK